MYKLDIGKALTKYFHSYSEAKRYCEGLGLNPARIKPVH